MLEWIQRGLGQGRITTRYPRIAADALDAMTGVSAPAQPYLAPARRPLSEQARRLRRSIHVRHIDCGSDGSEEWEIQALWNPYYDIQRLGFFLTSSPRHADVLLVTGPVTAPMRAPLRRTWEVMPAPKALVAVGDEACARGLCQADELTAGGVDAVLDVDVYVPGAPPPPVAILDGLLLAAGLPVPERRAA
jgi:Ni,Fe-hydrogenase III small subunit